MGVIKFNENDPVERIIGEALGAASMCWEHVENAGVFQSEEVQGILEEVMFALRRKPWFKE